MVSVQVRFLQNSSLSLIHIPLALYPHFLNGLISLITSNSSGNSDSRSENLPGFINISLTPVECSIVCPRLLVEKLFDPIIDELSSELKTSVSISPEDFVAIQVEGEELNAGQRVLDLSSPLALVGVYVNYHLSIVLYMILINTHSPIFFITTYYSDYILCPAKRRSTVIKALRQRGFVFEELTSSFVTQSSLERKSSSSGLTASINGLPSPPIVVSDSLSDLEARTFETLKKHNISPLANGSIKLHLCGDQSHSSELEKSLLELGLIKSLLAKPQFLSITITDTENTSVLLQEELIERYFQDPISGKDILMGTRGTPAYSPIVLDLKELPEDTTGIVCGLAGRLVGIEKEGEEGRIEMSYLSTARAGTVMVAEEDLETAVVALRLQ